MVELPLLIRADKDGVEQAALLDYELDLAYGKDENDFIIRTAERSLEEGDRLYMAGTEYGGIVSGIKFVTTEAGAEYAGRTWQGLLAERILEPDAGQDFLTVSGELNTVLAELIARISLSGLMAAGVADTGVTTTYQFDRYTDAHTGIVAMLKEVGYRLSFVWEAGQVVVSAEATQDYTDDETLFRQKYTAGMTVTQQWRKVNHLICAGKGDLAARTIVHLYADAAGTISSTQSFFGVDEVAALYDYSSAESLEVLETKGREKFEALRAKDTITLDLTTVENYQVGDIVGAVEGSISVARPITKKIVKVKDGLLTVEYDVE